MVLITLSVGIFVLFGASETADNENFQQWTIDCDAVLESVNAYCSRVAKLINTIPKIPIEKIPRQVKSIHAHLSINGSWLIDDHSMFHNFSNLNELFLVGPATFSDTYSKPVMKATLLKTLFQIPTLHGLSLWYWKLDDSYTWTFSDSITSLTLFRCGYTKLDLSSCSKLIYLNTRACNLNKIPKLSTPPPPLKTMILADNPNIYFTVLDIVYLCGLQSLTLKIFNQHLPQPEKYCECKRLKMYLKEFNIAEYELSYCGNLTADCKDYPIEEIIKVHKKACGIPLQTSTTPSSNQTTSSITIGPIILTTESGPIVIQKCPEKNCWGFAIGSFMLFIVLLAVIFILVHTFFRS